MTPDSSALPRLTVGGDVHHPDLLWLLIGALVIGTVAVSYAMDRRNGGQHVWSPGAALRAPAGDPTTVTRHAWRPGAGEDTIRVHVLRQRIDAEARLVALARKQRNKVDALVRRLTEAQGGRHRLAEDPGTGPLLTHPQLITHAAAA